MPFCNRTDTGFKVTRRESEPTSDRWYVARKLGEPLMWGKANGRCITGVCTSNIVERQLQRLWVGIAKVAWGAFRVPGSARIEAGLCAARAE